MASHEWGVISKTASRTSSRSRSFQIKNCLLCSPIEAVSNDNSYKAHFVLKKLIRIFFLLGTAQYGVASPGFQKLKSTSSITENSAPATDISGHGLFRRRLIFSLNTLDKLVAYASMFLQGFSSPNVFPCEQCWPFMRLAKTLYTHLFQTNAH